MPVRSLGYWFSQVHFHNVALGQGMLRVESDYDHLFWVGMNYYVGYGASDFTHRFGYFLLSVLVGSDK